jgi:adenylyltransferase/sulfurtransferase
LTLSDPSALSALTDVNPDCQVGPLPSALTRGVAAELLQHVGVVVASGAAPAVCDVLNAACVAQGTTLVWGETLGAFGLVTVLRRDRADCPCYTCLHPQLSQLFASADATHALAESTAAFIGTLQATEAIKQVIGVGRPTTARLLVYDAAAGTMGDVAVSKDPYCSTCAVCA